GLPDESARGDPDGCVSSCRGRLEDDVLETAPARSFDFPILGVAAALRCAPDGTVEDARIVLGAVASRPVIAGEAAALLRGQRPTPDLIAHAAQVAFQPAKPLDNADLTIGYRKKMTKVYVDRALRELAGLPFE